MPEKGRPPLGKKVTRMTISFDEETLSLLEQIKSENDCTSIAEAVRVSVANHRDCCGQENLLASEIDLQDINFFQEYISLLGKSNMKELLLGLQIN
jgi:hypothetical protein